MSTRSYGPSRAAIESHETFECFGGTCTVIVADSRRPADAAEAVGAAKRSLLSWHRRFSRFERDSELSRFNRDPRTDVPASAMMRRLLEVALTAALDTGGLVDATLGAEIERAGYASHFAGTGLGAQHGLSAATARAPAGPSPVS
ncbi:MAG: FAD:protein FMN transferase, partial [Solirubrobacteraceae bacterium]